MRAFASKHRKRKTMLQLKRKAKEKEKGVREEQMIGRKIDEGRRVVGWMWDRV